MCKWPLQHLLETANLLRCREIEKEKGKEVIDEQFCKLPLTSADRQYQGAPSNGTRLLFYFILALFPLFN